MPVDATTPSPWQPFLPSPKGGKRGSREVVIRERRQDLNCKDALPASSTPCSGLLEFLHNPLHSMQSGCTQPWVIQAFCNFHVIQLGACRHIRLGQHICPGSRGAQSNWSNNALPHLYLWSCGSLQIGPVLVECKCLKTPSALHAA